jgi:hypothetical protein
MEQLTPTDGSFDAKNTNGMIASIHKKIFTNYYIGEIPTFGP